MLLAAPSFIEAPVDVEVSEGDSIKLPCRAQGRPVTRIIWDRVGYAPPPTINEDVSQFLDEESQEELIAKAKIMSLRSKRQQNVTEEEQNEEEEETVNATKRKKRQILVDSMFPNIDHIPDLYLEDDANRNKREPSNFVVSEFRQIMRDSNQETFDTNFRNKREIASTNVESIGVIGPSEETISATDSTPILFFSTPSPTETKTLEVNENGELVLSDVTAKDQGWYACAGLNEAGSKVKQVFVRVISANKDEKNIPTAPEPPEPPGNRWSSEQNILITSVMPSSSNSLDVTWETTEGIPTTTLTLHYRPVQTIDFQTATAMIDSKEFTISELKAHTEYEVFATVPHGLSGSVSNIRIGKTMDGIPSAPPSDVRVGVINNTAAYVRWSPPPINMLNGELTGYKVNEAHFFKYFVTVIAFKNHNYRFK